MVMMRISQKQAVVFLLAEMFAHEIHEMIDQADDFITGQSGGKYFAEFFLPAKL